VDTSFRLFPPQASQMASQVDALMLFVLGVSVFFTVVIFACIAFFIFKYRARPGHKAVAVADNLLLEVVWTGVPLVLLMVMCVWGARLYYDAQSPPANAMEVFVTGKQWMWKIQHPEGRREINALHVPAGIPVKLTLTSQDVIHDFSVPDFRIKKDVRPGGYSTEWFIATQPGTYRLYCDQYCGAKHAEMVGEVIVTTPAEYASWLAGAPSEVSAQLAGKRLFTLYGCAACHGQYGPTLAGLYGHNVDVIDENGERKTVVADEDYLRESILYPARKLVVGYPNRMPSFQATLSEEQVADLVAYLKSLSGAAAASPYTGPPTGAATQPTAAEPQVGDAPFQTNREAK